MKRIIFLVLAVGLGLGCARVKVGGSKEPIKIDISMRLDIYQHVTKDIDDIESIVSGAGVKAGANNGHSLMRFFVGVASAEEGLSPEVEAAALRRKDRKSELSSWQGKGVIGANQSGIVEIRAKQDGTLALEGLIKAENGDRMIIYQAVAKKNGTSVEEVQKLYAKRLQSDAPTGTPIEVLNAATGDYEWQIKK